MKAKRTRREMALDESTATVVLPGDPRRARLETLLDGRLQVVTPYGVEALNRMFIEHAPSIPGENILAIEMPDALPLAALACLRPGATARYFHLDLYRAGQARELAAENRLTNLTTICEPNVPRLDPAPDLILLALRKDAEGGLSLELLRQAHARLAVGAKLITATNNPNDKWLRGQLEKIFGNLTLLSKSKHGLLYLTKRTDKPSPAAGADGQESGFPAGEFYIKHVEVAQFGETLAFETSYGTFSSDGLDEGSLALLEVVAANTAPGIIYPSLLDLGCGWGAVGILAARRFAAKRAVMIDANARAVWLAGRNGAAHAPGVAEVRHEANLESIAAGEEIGRFDLVLGNPPYGTEFRVSEMFLKAGLYALKPGGRIWLVARHNPVLIKRMEEMFGNVEVHHRRGYEVVTAERRR